MTHYTEDGSTPMARNRDPPEDDDSDDQSDEHESVEYNPYDLRYDPGEKEPLRHGVKIRGKIKRGSGTRDQDTLVVEGRGESAREAVEDFDDALAYIEEEGVTDRLRALQPEQEGDDDA